MSLTLSSFTIDPFLQSVYHAKYAITDGDSKTVQNLIQNTPTPPLPLKDRIKHLCLAVVLAVPLINTIVHVAWKIFSKGNEPFNQEVAVFKMYRDHLFPLFTRTLLVANYINNSPENESLTRFIAIWRTLSIEEIESIAPFIQKLNFDSFADEYLLNTFLPLCTNLRSLTIRNTNITHLPELRRCNHLDCSNCIHLRAIPDSFNTCETLNCSSCTSLNFIPRDLRNCTNLNTSNCPSLRLSGNYEIGTRNYGLPLPYSGPTNLNSDVPNYFNESLDVPTDDLANSPKKWLRKLGKDFLLNGKSFPSIRFKRISRNNSFSFDGTDMGGLKRVFASEILSKIFKQSEDWRSSDDLNYIKIENDLPFCNETEEDMTAFRTIGHLFGLAFPGDSYFKIGNLFSQEFYDAIVSLNDPILPEELWLCKVYLKMKGVSDRLISFLRNKDGITLVQLNETEKHQLYGLLPESEETLEQFLKTIQDVDFRRQLYEEVIHEARNDARIRAILNTALGFFNVVHDHREDLKRNYNGILLKNRLEGELTSSLLKQSIIYLNESRLDRTRVNTTIRFLNKWIEDANAAKLSDFVKAITGVPTLSSKKITIQFNSPYGQTAQLPVSHTCSNTLDLPITYTDQNEFNEKMDLFVIHGSSPESFGFS